jgi:MFS family permease
MTATQAMPSRRRGLIAVIVSVTSIGLSMGLTMPLIALVLERDGVTNTVIGLNTAMGALAMLVMAPLLPRLMAAIGTLGALYLGIALAALTILLLPLLHNLPAWFALRFVLGVGIAIHWVASETWINMAADERYRGRVVAIYVTLLAAGFAGGPLLIGVTGIDGFLPFGAGAALIALAAVPLLFTRGDAPPVRRPGRIGLVHSMRRAPALMAAVALAGFAHIGVFALLPVYAVRLDLGRDMAVTMLSVFMAGSVVLQFPLGWLADRFHRGRVLAGAAAVGFGGALALPALLDAGPVLWAVLFLWGGIVIGIYTIGMAILGQSFRPAALAAASAAFVMLYETGSMVGPVIAGGAMDAIGPSGLPLTLALAFAVLFVMALGISRRG